MLKRRYRLKLRRDFKQIYQRGRSVNTANLSFRALPNRLGHNRLAVVVSTKISKKATIRNRIRRRIAGELRAIWPQLTAGHDLVITVRADIATQKPQLLKQELTEGFLRLELLANNA